MVAVRAITRVQDADDVSLSGAADGDLLAFNSTTGGVKHTPSSLAIIGDTKLFGASTTLTSSLTVKGVDDSNNIWSADSLGLYCSTDGGVTWSMNKGFPPNTTAGTNVGKILKWATSLLCVAYDETATVWKVYSATYSSDNTTLTWTARLTLTSGDTRFYTNFNRSPSGWSGTTGILVADYGDPSGGPSIWRCTSPPAGAWTRVFGPDATLRHIHTVAYDPYAASTCYAICGDGTSKTILRSTDSGATWSTWIASASWQGVQMSFTPDWIWVAGDGNLGSVFVIDRSTGTPYWASQNMHYNIAVPGGTTGDRFCREAFQGIVDPATGIYYCIANDTSAGGNTSGLFYLPRLGSSLQLIESAAPGTTWSNEMFIVQTTLYFAQFKRALIQTVRHLT